MHHYDIKIELPHLSELSCDSPNCIKIMLTNVLVSIQNYSLCIVDVFSYLVQSSRPINASYHINMRTFDHVNYKLDIKSI